MIIMSVHVLTCMRLYRCACGHCSAMNSEKESICYLEIAEMVQLLDKGDVRPVGLRLLCRHTFEKNR